MIAISSIAMTLVGIVATLTAGVSQHLYSNQSIVREAGEFSWGSPSNNLEVGVAPTRSTYVAGRPIEIRIALRNIGSASRSILQASLIYNLNVVDAKGYPAAGRPDVVFGYHESNGKPLVIAPGDAIESTRSLSDLYVLKPGRYLVSAGATAEEVGASSSPIPLESHLTSSTIPIVVN